MPLLPLDLLALDPAPLDDHQLDVVVGGFNERARRLAEETSEKWTEVGGHFLGWPGAVAGHIAGRTTGFWYGAVTREPRRSSSPSK